MWFVCVCVCVYIYIYIYICGFGFSYVRYNSNKFSSLNNLLLDVNFDKFSIELHYIHILHMLKILRWSTINSQVINNYLNSSFCNLK